MAENSLRGAMRQDARERETSSKTGLGAAVYGTVEELVHGIVEMFKAPGNVYKGMLTPKEMESAAREMALNLVGGPVPKPKGAAGIFGGRLGAGPKQKEALVKAEGMEQAGKSREAIYEDTGWFKGVDGKWRFEIPDNEALLNHHKIVGGEAGDVLLHPHLYNHYPELDKLPIRTGMEPGRAYSHAGENELAHIRMSGDDIATRPDFAKEVVLHELQHQIQAKEGFAGGANVDAIRMQLYDNAANAGIIPNKKLIDKLEIKARDQYYKNSGEVEARNVGDRASYTPEMRRNIPPWATEDVLPRDQIVKGSSGQSLKLTPIGTNPFAPLITSRDAQSEDFINPQHKLNDGNAVSKEMAAVPRTWTSPGHDEAAILTYITPTEFDRLRKLDMHNSGVDETMHYGPGGVPSLQGDGMGGGSSDTGAGSSNDSPDGPGTQGGSVGVGGPGMAGGTIGGVGLGGWSGEYSNLSDYSEPPPEVYGPPEMYGPPQFGISYGQRAADMRAVGINNAMRDARELGLYGGWSTRHDPQAAGQAAAMLNALGAGQGSNNVLGLNPGAVLSGIANKSLSTVFGGPIGMINSLSGLLGGPSLGKGLAALAGDSDQPAGQATIGGETNDSLYETNTTPTSKKALLLQLLQKLQAEGFA